MDYTKWAEQYAKTLATWGWIESIVHGWVQDLYDRDNSIDSGAAYGALRALPRK